MNHFHLYIPADGEPIVELLEHSRDDAVYKAAQFLSHFFSRPERQDKLMLKILNDLESIEGRLDHSAPAMSDYDPIFTVHIHECDEDCNTTPFMN